MGGYPELKITTLLDSYMTIIAKVFSNKFIRLKEPIYHQFHELRGKYVARDQKEYLSKFKEDARKMLREKKAIKYNGPNWGLKNIKLPEVVIGENGKPRKI